jgi:hypothetical protein
MPSKPTRREWLKGLAAAPGGWVAGLAGRAAPPAAGVRVSAGPVTQIMDGILKCRTVETADGPVTICCLDACGRPPDGPTAPYRHDLGGGITAITFGAPPPNLSPPA